MTRWRDKSVSMCAPVAVANAISCDFECWRLSHVTSQRSHWLTALSTGSAEEGKKKRPHHFCHQSSGIMQIAVVGRSVSLDFSEIYIVPIKFVRNGLRGDSVPAQVRTHPTSR